MTIRIILTLTLTVFTFCQGIAQTPEQILEKYYASVGDLKTLRYRMQTIDTFLTGTVWNKTGDCLLKRDRNDLFGFLFRAKRDDVDAEGIFTGNEFYEVNHKQKSYTVQTTEIHRGLLGSPSGQMVLSELVQRVEGYNKLSLQVTDSSYILRFDFPDNDAYQIKNRFKEIHIDQKNYLPFYRYHTLENLGSKQVNIAILSAMKMNEDVVEDQFNVDQYHQNYKLIVPKRIVDSLSDLINKKAPNFALKDLEGNVYTVANTSRKLILINFWEIWCGPCVASIDSLKRLESGYRDNGFEIWSIVSDTKTFHKVREFSAKRSLPYVVLLGDTATSNAYKLQGVPLYVLVDRDGIIRYASMGYSPEIEKAIRSHL